MAGMTRRGVFGLFGGGAALAAGKVPAVACAAGLERKAPPAVTSFNWARMELFRRGVIAEVGEDAFSSWFGAVELERLEAGKLTVSVPATSLKRWLDRHYGTALLRGGQRMDAAVEEVEIVLRKPTAGRVPSRDVGV